MKKQCKTCKKEFEGEEWKKQCYDCYKHFRGWARISTAREHQGVIIVAHPNVTKEEVNEWIKQRYGSVNDPSNWGATELYPYMKIWWNCQDDD